MFTLIKKLNRFRRYRCTCSDSMPAVRHAYMHSLELYKRGNDKKPIARAVIKDDCKISLLKFILILLCAVITAILTLKIIGHIKEAALRRKLRSECAGLTECDFDE